MRYTNKLLLVHFIVLYISFQALCAFTFHRGYERHIIQYPCTRTFSTSGSIGCRSPETTPSSGILLDVNRHINIINDDFATDFVAVLSGQFFNKSVITTLFDTGRLKGVVVYDSPEDGVSYLHKQDARYSTDVRTPQGDETSSGSFTLDPSYPWNVAGNGIAYSLKNFPIVRAEQQEIAILLQLCKENHDNNYIDSKLNVAELNFYMGGGGNVTSADCLGWVDLSGQRAPQCYPLGTSYNPRLCLQRYTL